MNEENIYNKHYIRLDGNDNIIKGFSDAFEQPKDGDILINEQGGYQFRLYPNGEENPILFRINGEPVYSYTNGEIIINPPPTEPIEREPTPLEQIQTLIDTILGV